MNDSESTSIRRISCGDIELAVQDAGSSSHDALLFVHAFPLNRRMWAPQISALSGEMHCIAPDLRGFGESGTGGPWTMDRFADDLACVLDSLNVQRTVVCGLSLGGYITLAFWRRHPDRVRALVLADTRAQPDSEEGREKRRGTIRKAQEEGAQVIADDSITGLLGKTTREQDGEAVSTARAILSQARVAGIVGASEAMMNRPDSTPTLATITVPTLVIVGAEDALTPPKDSRTMANAIANAKLDEIPGAGHLSNIERPAAFTHALRDFVSSLPPDSQP
ncbi:MAG TPA: alpha/beta fold hydrolase [Gemmatimonadales bacterium]|nr:alpha/beta fold hydrolase [Gemmatimonadales bacterium]